MKYLIPLLIFTMFVCGGATCIHNLAAMGDMFGGGSPEEGGGIISDVGGALVDVATFAGVIPPWLAPIIYGVLGAGGTTMEVKRRKQKKERKKLGLVIERLKDEAPELVDQLLDAHGVKDKKFYEKEIKPSLNANVIREGDKVLTSLSNGMGGTEEYEGVITGLTKDKAVVFFSDDNSVEIVDRINVKKVVND